MDLTVESCNQTLQPASSEVEAEQARVVLEELQKIAGSRFFKNSVRSRQFLEFVVARTLEGHADQLKERTIGTELYHRSPGYATGDDPVVRVQAGEVRRRLEQFYQSEPCVPRVKIELPVGSYSPHFLWKEEETAKVEETPAEHSAVPPKRVSLRTVALFAAGVGVLLVAGLVFLRFSSISGARQQARIDQFWAPVFATPQPVLICLAKPVAYRPSAALFQRYSEKHSGAFATEVERSNRVLPLNPSDKLTWSEMTEFADYGVAVGDVYAAVQVSGLLGKINKPSQVRIGSSYSFEDLRNSPSVVVGAFNNRWTMQLSQNLHFALVEEKEQFSIREQIPNGRKWESRFSEAKQTGEDYAIVARLLDSKTGQFTIIAAGITGSGTQAAGEFLSRPEFMEKDLSDAPSDWQKKNMELVLQTSVIDFVPGPPKVVAAYYW